MSLEIEIINWINLLNSKHEEMRVILPISCIPIHRAAEQLSSWLDSRILCNESVCGIKWNVKLFSIMPFIKLYYLYLDLRQRTFLSMCKHRVTNWLYIKLRFMQNDRKNSAMWADKIFFHQISDSNCLCYFFLLFSYVC